MKNRFTNLIALGCALALPAMLQAQDPSPSSGRIGVINIQEAIAGTAEGKRAFGEIQKKYDPRRQQLESTQKDIAALQDQLQKQGSTLSDEERVRLNRELEKKQRDFKQAGDDAQAEFQADNQDIMRRIGQKMMRVINDYAQQNGFAVVMDDSQLPVYYVAKGNEITEPIMKLYDQANPDVGAPTGPAASAPSPSAPATKPAAVPPARLPASNGPAKKP